MIKKTCVCYRGIGCARGAAANAVTAVGGLYEVDKRCITGTGRSNRRTLVVKLAALVDGKHVDVGIKHARHLDVSRGFNVVCREDQAARKGFGTRDLTESILGTERDGIAFVTTNIFAGLGGKKHAPLSWANDRGDALGRSDRGECEKANGSGYKGGGGGD